MRTLGPRKCVRSRCGRHHSNGNEVARRCIHPRGEVPLLEKVAPCFGKLTLLGKKVNKMLVVVPADKFCWSSTLYVLLDILSFISYIIVIFCFLLSH